MKYLFPRNGKGNSERTECDNHFSPFEDFNFCRRFRITLFVRIKIGNITDKESCRNKPPRKRRRKEIEEIDESSLLGCPYHERRNISKRAPSTSGISRNNNIDRTGDKKLFCFIINREQYRGEDQGGRKIIGYRRDKKCQNSGNPEKFAVTVPFGNQFRAQCTKNSSLNQCLNIGHRDK